ncbi:MAG: ABC transporter permease, partial [Candidatus Wallbacteria bacterium]|nr:ABC transporter permease [Candidatus Wallbacteria bacterium]
MFERLLAMLKKEFLQLFRDPRMRAVAIFVPVLQTMIFGYAVNTDVRHIVTAFEDQDNSSASRAVLAGFQGSSYFSLDYFTRNPLETTRLLDEGKIRLAIRIRKGFAEMAGTGKSADLQLLIDGTDSNSAALILNYSQQVIAQLNHELLAERVKSAGIDKEIPSIQVQSRVWFNQTLESRNFYIPGVLGLMLTVITLLLSSMSIVREKEVGTIEQLIVTPIRKSELILGKTIPYALVGFLDVTLILLLAVKWFHIPFMGSLILLYSATGLFLMSSLGVGLLISTVSSTQQQAMMSCFFLIFPTILLSGFAFPIENMPEFAQYLTVVNPLRYFVVIIRGVFLKGIGFNVLTHEFAALAVI